MEKLNAAQLQARNEWFKMVFFPALKEDEGFSAEEIKAAKDIYQVIRNSSCVDIDNAFKILGSTLWAVLNGNTTPCTKYMASFCQEKGIYFDDYKAPKQTKQEIDAFKDTLFGKALLSFECFVSQDPQLVADQSHPQQAQSHPQTIPNRSSTSLGKPYLKDCNGIVNGQKVTFTSYVYWIRGDWTPEVKAKISNKDVPRVHVKPLRPLVNNVLTTYTNGSGQGYKDCVIFWASVNEAMAACETINKSKHDFKVSTYFICKQKPKGEYYKVDTDVGQAYIKASNLIEMLEAENKEILENIQAAEADVEKYYGF